MKDRVVLKDIHTQVGNIITVCGIVDVRRDHGKLIFIDLRDRSGSVQVVFHKGQPAALEAASKLKPESSVMLKALVQERPENMRTEAQNGMYELEAHELTILSTPEELPFSKDADINLDTYLDHLPLTLRNEKQRAIFTVQSEILKAFRAFLNKEDFTEFQAPKLVGDDAEGGANVFKVEYLGGKDAYLATSPQFYKQIMVGVFERVFTTGNVYRAEKHSTTRHINEYTSIDIEMGFIEGHEDIMRLEERLMAYIVEHLQATCAAEFTLLGATFPATPASFPRLKLKEAQDLIFKLHGDDSRGEPDLEPQHERWLCEWAKSEHNSDFVFVTHYPVAKRPMYTMEDPEDVGFTKSFDLLFRGVEITTGGQRRHEYQNLIDGIKMKGLDPDMFSYYLQAFRYGMPPHGGFGMGLERLTAKMLGVENVKEATLFPRDLNRIDTLLST